MAFVADLLDSWLRKHGEKLARLVNDGDNPFLTELVNYSRNLWISSDFGGGEKFDRVAAVDGGLMKFRLANGGSIIFVSAYAYGCGIEERDFTCVVAYPPSFKYASLLMKSLELKVARKTLKQLSGDGFLLLDGSLYGLLSTPPITPTNSPPDYGELLLRFYEELADFLDEAKRFQVKVVSIAKISSSSSLRDFIISRQHAEEVRRLKELGYIEPRELETIENILYSAFRNPRQALRTVEKLKTKYAGKLENLFKIISETIFRTPDLLLLKNCFVDEGYTAPLLLGASSRLRDFFLFATRNPEMFAENKLRLSVDKAPKVYEVLNRLQAVTAVVSSYVRFDSRDYPLKIDLPAFTLDSDEKFFEIYVPQLFNTGEKFVKLLSALREMYGSKEVYNVWLYEADRRARLRKTDAPILMEFVDKALGPVELSRRQIPEPPG
ncbi:MAG: DNA double-strand break repair nuclease NurA [Candidatus Caldarchaeum sp.]